MTDLDHPLPVLRTAPGRRIRMSPREIRHTRLAETRLGRRGYERDEVDRLLARIAEDAQNATDEIAVLRAELQRLRDYYRRTGTDVDLELAHHVDAAQVALLARAQAQAERTISEARRQAVLEMTDVRTQAALFLARVHRDAEELKRRHQDNGENADLEREQRLVAWLNTIRQTVGGAIPVLQAQLEGISQALAWEVYHRESTLAVQRADTPAQDTSAVTRHRSRPDDHRASGPVAPYLE
jgi:DivIVA domain-containing protein